MIPLKKDVYLIFLVVFFSAPITYGQSIFDSMDVLNQYSSQRSKALGYSTVALDGYPGAAAINPATIGMSNIFQASSYFMNNRHSWLSRVYERNSNLYQPYVDVKFRRWAMAAYVTYLDYGNLVFSDPYGDVLGQGHSFQYSISLAGAYPFTSSFTGGLGLRYITDKPGMSSLNTGYRLNNAHAFAMDFGIFYKKIYDFGSIWLKPTSGWSLTNFGTLLHYNETETDPLPMMIRGGLGLRLITKNEVRHHPVVEVGFYSSVSHILARKKGNGRVLGPFEALIKGWSPYYQDYTENYISFLDQFYAHFGLESTFWGIVSLRGGYIIKPAVLGYNDVKSAGIGLDINYLTFDFTYSYGDRFNTFGSKVNTLLQMTIRIPFHSSKRHSNYVVSDQ